MTERLKIIHVAAVALIDADFRVLLAKRPVGRSMAGLWEFPGGKLEEGEAPEVALVRELKEEIDIRVEPEDLVPLTFASHRYEGFHLVMPLFLCRKWHGAVLPLEKQNLFWVDISDIGRYKMPPADIPLIPALTEAVCKMRFAITGKEREIS